MLIVVAGLTVIAMLAAPVDVPGAPPAADASPPAAVAFGDSGKWVGILNERLADAGFHPDTEAEFGKQTRHAVYAFQKHYGLEKTGEFTADMWALLDREITLPVRQERNRIEVDLAKQVLYFVEEGRVELVLPVSSGSGGTYRRRGGGYARATTPEGKFTFERKVDGYRRSYLGVLYNPFYFRGGYAIHGSPSVPNQPVSHGCIRLTNWDIELLKPQIDLGWTIYVYGQRTPPPDPYEIPTPRPTAI